MPQNNTYQLEIVVSIPSITIFYPDLTYSFGDNVREYDALIIAKINNQPIVLLAEEVSSHEESGKVIVDLTLEYPPVLYVFNKTNDYKMFLTPLRLSIRNLSLPRTIQPDKLANIWANGYDLFNLLFYSLLFMHRETLEKILNDISELEVPRNTNLCLLSELSKCLKSIIINNNSSNNIISTSEKIKSFKYINISTPKPADKIIAKLAAKETVVYLLPQLLREYESSKVRKYFPINLALAILNILSGNTSKLYFRVIGLGAGAQYSKYILNEIKCFIKDLKINCDIKGIIEMKPEAMSKIIIEDAEKIVSETTAPNVLVVVAGDYNKKLFTELIVTIASIFKNSKYKILVFPEVIYCILRDIEKKLVSTNAPLNYNPEKRKEKKVNPIKSILEKDILLIEDEKARKLIKLLTQLRGEK
ncbi:MAG: hypothetical protein DRN04_08840 [Thermoprotei archaeon]|nr:MAG: hypothetical protein DRN04_08840 [Thermoprotei archaeon]